MSEWRTGEASDYRVYDASIVAEAGHESGWSMSWGAPQAASYTKIGSECLPFSRELCDEAAVACALIVLAKRAAAWARDVDARLAREYRAARLEYLRATRAAPNEHDYRRVLFNNEREAHEALMHGWP